MVPWLSEFRLAQRQENARNARQPALRRHTSVGMASAPSFVEGRDAVVMLSSSTTRKYFAQHVASIASALFFNPEVEVHVHTAYDHQIMAAELLKLPFARESTAMQRLHFHPLSPRPAGQLTLILTLALTLTLTRTRT